MRYYYTLLLGLWVATLPAQQTVGLFANTPESYNGYTLFTPAASKTTYLIDNCGREVHRWESLYNPGLSVYLMEDGSLIRTGRLPSDNFGSGGQGGIIEWFDWDNNLLWSYSIANDSLHQHHDIEPLPNGNLLVLAWDRRERAAVIAEGRDSTTFGAALWAERIIEIQPIASNAAAVVWQWSLWDHIVQDHDPSKENYGTIAEQPGKMDINFFHPNGGGPDNADWVHANSIDYHPDLDQIIINSRTLGEFWVINHSVSTQEVQGPAGDFLYRWGNPNAYDRGAASERVFFGQHDARWIGEGLPGAGNILVFNNGDTRGYSSVDELIPPTDGQGGYLLEPNEAYGPEGLHWTYVAPTPSDFFSHIISGAHRLPNGNTLACEGVDGRFIEVSPEGDIQWEYRSPVGMFGPIPQGSTTTGTNVFRAERYAPDYPAFDGKELIPGDYIELDPFPSDCQIASPVVEAGGVPPVVIGYSPLSDKILIQAPYGEKWHLSIFDAAGRAVSPPLSGNGDGSFDISHLPRGFYALSLENRDAGEHWHFHKKIIKP